ncbi:hypothetical protein OPQ81_009810 [Rhizoctonia solani]|nr:hypothetical protein OPQ81_009810 [Rhizoctonia solani]
MIGLPFRNSEATGRNHNEPNTHIILVHYMAACIYMIPRSRTHSAGWCNTMHTVKQIVLRCNALTSLCSRPLREFAAATLGGENRPDKRRASWRDGSINLNSTVIVGNLPHPISPLPLVELTAARLQ